MSEIIVRKIQQSDLLQIREIFFESSIRKEFKDQIDKDLFEYKYLGFYLKHFPFLCFVASQENKVLGYIVGSPESLTKVLFELQPHLEAFKKYFSEFPAHLHINCHADSRGKGVGSLLVRRIIDELNSFGVYGVHIMTGHDSLNREFYRKLGFDFEALEEFRDHPILLMGKKLRV